MTSKLDRQGREFDPAIHEVTKTGKPKTAFGYLVIKKDGGEDDADSVESAKLEVGETFKNPELETKRVYDDVVAGTETEAQLRAKLEKEIKEKLMRERIEQELRASAQREINKQKAMNAAIIQIDPVQLQKWADFQLKPIGGQFVIDRDANGDLIGTWHAIAFGKSVCGRLDYPEHVIKRNITSFKNNFAMVNAQTIDAPSAFGGTMKATVAGSVPLIDKGTFDAGIGQGEALDFGS